jgi:HlyD family secretion protein
MSMPVRRTRKWIIGFFILVALGVVFWITSGGGKPVRVRFSHPVRGRVEEIVTSNSVGSVEPLKNAVVSSEIVGRVKTILVRQGDVKAGQSIFELDSRDLEAEREVTRRDIATSRARIDQAELRKKKVSEDLERLKKVDVPKSDVERLERDLEIASKDEDISKLEILRLDAQLTVLDLRLAKTNVTAPFDGVVTRLLSEEGESVTPGKALFQIHSAGELLIRAPIDEVDMGRLSLGLPVRLSFDAYEGEKFEGTLHEIMPAASMDQKNNRTVDIKIRAPKMPRNIYANMSANIEVLLRAHDEVIHVPTHLVHEDRNRNEKYVFILDLGVARKRMIKTGFTNWETVEVTAGLETGDTLVVPLQFQDEAPVTEGTKVILYEDGK